MIEQANILPNSATDAAASGRGLIVDATPSDIGFLYGVRLLRGGGLDEIEFGEIDTALDSKDLVWLHFNLSNARARSMLTKARFVPPELQEVFQDLDMRRRVESLDSGVMAVISDLIFEAEAEPAEVSPLWCFVGERLLITARVHPLKTTDELRAAIRAGLRAEHAIELLAWLLARRTSALNRLAHEMSEQVSEIEDEILGGTVKEQRVQLGRIRRFCARTRRHFAPDRSAFLRLLQRRDSMLSETHAELIRSEIEALSFLIDEAAELYERAKLLQEELASRVAEDTGRNLWFLAILSAVFLPMTLVTGIFGMNVAGLPGLHSPAAFWVVMLLIIGVGVAISMYILSRSRN